MKPLISVIISAHNPRADYMRRVLEGLRTQTLPAKDWELVLVDNASEQPLNGRFDVSWHPNGSHVREEKLGLTPARLAVPNLIERLYDEADCLLVTGSFEPNNANVVNTQFPSKGADYSAAGLPLFVWVPPNTAIARFVQKHSGVAESVTDRDPEALAPATARLATADHRYRLAKAIIDVGAQRFSPEAAWESFARALLGSSG